MLDDLLQEPFRVTEESGLSLVSDLLHDEAFDLDDIQFDAAAGVVTMPVRRQFHSGPERLIRRGLFFRTYEKEWMHSLITIRRVRSWKTAHDQGIGTYSFNTWSYRDGTIEAKCCEWLVLRFSVADLDLEVADKGFAGKARLRRGPLGIEIDSLRVYD